MARFVHFYRGRTESGKLRHPLAINPDSVSWVDPHPDCANTTRIWQIDDPENPHEVLGSFDDVIAKLRGASE